MSNPKRTKKEIREAINKNKSNISDTIDTFGKSIDGLDEQLQRAREVQGILNIINTVQSQITKQTNSIEILTKICKEQQSRIKILENQ